MPRPVLVFSLILCLLAPVAAARAEAARAALDRFADGLVALEGRFEQQVFNGDGSLRETAAGTVAHEVLVRLSQRAVHQPSGGRESRDHHGHQER